MLIPIYLSERTFERLMVLAGRDAQQVTTFDEIIRALLDGRAEAPAEVEGRGYIDALRAGARNLAENEEGRGDPPGGQVKHGR